MALIEIESDTNPGQTLSVTEAFGHVRADVRAKAAQSPEATAAQMTRALCDHNKHVRIAALRCPNMSHSHWRLALTDHDVEVLTNVAWVAPAEFLDEIFTTSPHLAVRKAVFENPNCTSELVEKGLSQSWHDIGIAAIESAGATFEQLDRILRGDRTFRTFDIVLANPNVTPAMIAWIRIGWLSSAAAKLVASEYGAAPSYTTGRLEAVTLCADIGMTPEQAWRISG